MPITPNQVEELLESAYKARKTIVPCLLGSPGIGKTQGVYDFAAKHGVKVVEIIASQILPNEVSGITMPVNETHSMEIYDHARLSSLKDGDILFFDELLQASPQTLSACLTLILERRLLSGKMLPDVFIVAAANPLPSATRIPTSIRQRFMFVNVQFDRNEWVDYIQRKYNRTVNSELKKVIVDDGEAWNVLTPRTATQLIEWGIECDCDMAWRLAIQDMFGLVVQREFYDTVMNMSNQQQIVDALSDLVDQDELQTIKEMSLKDIFDRLIALPNWNEIEERLKETQCTN